ncbi:MAG: CPBP family intramembrane metalloprotease [Phycisphaerae bacterium]|nr:CPBP family intramembrane metalloprotease [Phycisphaerae bacterium]
MLLIAPAPSVGVYLGMARGRARAGTILWILAKIWLFGLPAAWYLLVDRQTWSWSLPPEGLGTGLLWGSMWGVIMAAVVLVTYFLVRDRWVTPAKIRTACEPLGLTRPLVFLAAAAFWILVNSVLEEYVYRWFIVTKAEGLLPTWAAVTLSAAIFVVHHAIAMATYFAWPATALASLGIFIAGAIWSVLYVQFESIWVPYISHAIVDLAIFSLAWRMIFSDRPGLAGNGPPGAAEPGGGDDRPGAL